MTPVADWAELAVWVAASIAVSCIIFGLAAGLAAYASKRWQRRTWTRRQAQAEWDRHVRQAEQFSASSLYEDDPPAFTHHHLQAQYERVGRHRDLHVLDDEPGEVIAALVTELQRKQDPR